MFQSLIKCLIRFADNNDVSHLSPLKLGEGPRKKGCGDNCSNAQTSEALWKFKLKALTSLLQGKGLWTSGEFNSMQKGPLLVEWLSKKLSRARLSKNRSVTSAAKEKWNVVVGSVSYLNKHFNYENTWCWFYESSYQRWIKYLGLLGFFIAFFGNISLSVFCFIDFKL